MVSSIFNRDNLPHSLNARSAKIVLLLLAFANVFYVLYKYREFCAYNWEFTFCAVFAVLVAAAALYIGKSWSYLIAILISGWTVWQFIALVLLHLNVPPFALDPDLDVRFEHLTSVMMMHPSEFTHTVLAAIILVFASFHIFDCLRKRKRVFR